MTQQEFAERIGATRSTVANWETGASSVPPLVLAQAADLFHVDPPSGNAQVVPIPQSLVKGKGVLPYEGVVPRARWDEHLGHRREEQVDAAFVAADTFVATIAGPTCWPFLQPQDLAVWKSDENPPYGVIVLVRNDDDSSCAIRVIEFDEDANETRLLSVNPRAAEPLLLEGWICIARLVGLIAPASDGPRQTWGPHEPGLRTRHILRQ